MIRALPLTITLALFLGAVLVQVIPGAGPDDALGASILAAIIFVMGGMSLMVSLLLLWWERRKGLSRSKGKLIAAGIAIACYASPFVLWGWDSMARERTHASYNLQFKVPQSTNVEAWEYEISGASGSMSGPFGKIETNVAGYVILSANGGTDGRRQVITLNRRPGRAPDAAFFVDLSKTKAAALQSDWLTADTTNADESYQFLVKGTRPAPRTPGTNEPMLRYSIAEFRTQRGR